MLDNTLSTDQYGLKRRRGQPWQADPFKNLASRRGGLDARSDHNTQYVRCGIVGIA